MIAYMHEDDEAVTNLLPAKAFEMSTTSRRHHQMNNNELNEFKPSFNQRQQQIELLFFSTDTKFVGI
ncbi:MAG TPA: hypothetical protein VIP70_10940 [Nitrososphaeraceae archaeon]